MKTKNVRGTMVKVSCKCCGIDFEKREADVKRGWGKFCSKRCAAISNWLDKIFDEAMAAQDFLDCGDK